MFNNRQTYNIINGQQSTMIDARFNRAKIQNLQEQAPFADGKRNRDFINPTLASNALLYNQGSDRLSNPHVDVTRTKDLPKGYNMNNYVAYQARNNDGRSGIQRSQRTGQDRSQRSDRHYNKSGYGGKSQKSQAQAPSNRQSQKEASQKLSQVNRSQRTGGDSRIERSYKKSQKSSKRGTERVTEAQPQQDNGPASQKQSTQLSASKITEFHRPTESEVSKADNLICDGCLNRDMHDKQQNELLKAKQKDLDFARRVQENLKQQLADERERKEKERLDFNEEARRHRLEQEEIKRQRAEFEKRDMEEFQNNTLAKNREIAQWEFDMNQGKRELFRQELLDQMADDQALKDYRREIELTIEKKNHNLLIDDDWQPERKKKARDEYNAGLREQLEDNLNRRMNELEKKNMDDVEYKKRVKALVEEERRRLHDARMLKHNVLNDALERQKQEKEYQRQEEARQEHIDNENWQRKIEQENAYAYEFDQMKKQQAVEHANGLRQQFGIKERRAQEDRDYEIAYQNKVIENAQAELREEEERNRQKRELYKDALINQKDEERTRQDYYRQQEKQQEKEFIDYNNKRNQAIENWERDMKDKQKKELINDLSDQMHLNQDLNRQKAEIEQEIDRKNHNLLLDDYWKHPLQKQMREQHRDEIWNQMQEDNERKLNVAQQQQNEDASIRRRGQEAYEQEQRFIEENINYKRTILKEDLEIQRNEKQVIKEHEDAIKAQERREMDEQLDLQKQQYLNNMFMKKKQNQEHLNELVKQLGDKEMERRVQNAEDKKPVDTTLTIPQKPDKCGNCAHCRGKYPLKRLNKKVRVPKRK